MKKVFNINLGGYPFTIDDDAYEHLNTYLKTIHNHFKQSEGYEEITSDIEGRMAELFQERLEGRTIVSMKDVNAAITIMGTPEDFGAEPVEEAITEDTEKSGGTKTGKRLYRNMEDEVVSGVCSGIAAYFGVSDPLWIRLAFIILVASSVGFIIPLYLILWAVLPKAETAADRLAMQGKAINVSNIAKTVEEEVEHISGKISELSEEFKSKKKALGALKEKISLPKGYHC